MIAVILVVLGALFVISLAGLAGSIGVLVQNWFTSLWGSIGYLIPFLFLWVGIGLFFPDRWPMKRATIFGLILLVLALPGLAAWVPTGGGILGDLIFGILAPIFGKIGTTIVLVGVLAVSLPLIFSRSLLELFAILRLRGDTDEDDDDQDDEEPRVSVFTTVKNKFGLGRPRVAADAPVRTLPVATGQPKALLMRRDPNWNFPSVELLATSNVKAQAGNISKNVETIQKTLKDFGIEVAMGDVHVGPTVSQYSFKPADGVKLNQITARQQDLALALAAHPLRLEAPIPGKAAVGLELPNKVAAVVTLREVLEAEPYLAAKSRLALALGRDVAGEPIIVDLSKMPHLLIAGATGSGKSISINGIILTLLYRNSPADLRLILVDPKRVEFTHYNGVPHLLAPVVTEPDKTVNVLRWAVAEMERRYRMFADVGSRDISSYNEKMEKSATDGETKLPSIVIVIDELADLMATSANEVEGAIVRLAQMARATGIHLIVATQRPSVDVITGLIKANIPTRIAFAVASQIDSRTIIDQAGAEKLLGRGDMLYLSADFANKPKRIQGVLVTEKEIHAVGGFLKEQGSAQYDESILSFGARGAGPGSEEDIDDDLYTEAKQVVMQSGKASASLLQRRLRVGYARAARLLDLLESQGVIGPADGARPRDVLVGRGGDNPNFDEA